MEPLATVTTAGATGPAPATELFLDRARLHGVHLDADPEHTAVLAELCRRLDGIPLAIELAAARTRSLTPTELLQRLDERFRLLARPRHWSAAARQQTLEATIAWSYSLLDSDEQATLRRLAVFRGGFDMAAAAAVCADLGSDLDALDWVSALVDRSLVQLQERASVARYRLLESIGLFAELRLAEHAEAAAARDRHAAHFAALVRSAMEHLDGPEEAAWLRRLEPEEDNFRAALHWCLDGDGDLSTGLDLACFVGRAWFEQGIFGEAQEWQERALAVAPPDLHAVTAEIHIQLTSLAGRHEADRILDHAARAVEAARNTGDRGLLARALQRVAIASVQGISDTMAAAVAIEEAQRWAEEAHQDRAAMWVAHGIAIVRFYQSDWTAARESAAAGRDIARRVGNARQEACADYWLALAAGAMGDVAAARRAADEGCMAADAAGSASWLVELRAAQAAVALMAGDHPSGRSAMARAAALAEHQQRPRAVSDMFWLGAYSAWATQAAEAAALLWHCGQRWWLGGLDADELSPLLPDLQELPDRLRRTLGDDGFAAACSRAAVLSTSEMLHLLGDTQPS